MALRVALRVDGGVPFGEWLDAGAVRVVLGCFFCSVARRRGGEGGIGVFLLLSGATHCSASVPLLFSKGMLQNVSATFAIRPSPFVICHLSFVIQKKSPPAFAEGLLKLGFDLWIIC
jgi:hypothetical protein